MENKINYGKMTDIDINIVLEQEWDKTFKKSEKVNHRKITFHNRYGITLVADLYEPKEYEGKLSANSSIWTFWCSKRTSKWFVCTDYGRKGIFDNSI